MRQLLVYSLKIKLNGEVETVVEAVDHKEVKCRCNFPQNPDKSNTTNLFDAYAARQQPSTTNLFDAYAARRQPSTTNLFDTPKKQ